MRSWRLPGRRSKQRGAAAVELALSLIFLVPLLLGTLDYGYYFWVAVNAVEAANEGGKAMTRAGSGVANCGNVVGVNNTTNAGRTAVTNYLNSSIPSMTANTTISVTCVAAAAPYNRRWRTQVIVDFRPAVGFVRAGMRPSPISGRVRYQTQPLLTP